MVSRSVVAATPQWACAEADRAVEIAELEAGGGLRTTDEVLHAEAVTLAGEGVGDEKSLLEAASAADGSGRLAVGGKVVAEVGFAQLPDKTWTVGSVTYCPLLPRAAHPR